MGAVALGSPESSAGIGGQGGAGGMRESGFDTRNVIDMLKCKKYIETAHGYGVLFQMHHWRIWLTYIMKIYKELHTEKNADGGSMGGSRRPSGRGQQMLGNMSAPGSKVRPGGPMGSDDESVHSGINSDTNNFMSIDGVSLKKADGSTTSTFSD